MKTLKIFAAVFCAMFIMNCAALQGTSLTDQGGEETNASNQGFNPESVPDNGPVASAVTSNPTMTEGSVEAPMPGESGSTPPAPIQEPDAQGYVSAPEAAPANAGPGRLTLPPGTPYGKRTVEFKFEHYVLEFWATFVTNTPEGGKVKVSKPSKTLKFILNPTPPDKPYYCNFAYDIKVWAVELNRHMAGKVYVRINGGEWVEFTTANTESGDNVHWNFRLDVP